MKRRIPIGRHASLTHGATVTLQEEAAHYARDVLRLTTGAHVELFDGEGHAATAELIEVSSDLVRARITEVLEDARAESRLHITLYQSLIKNDRFDWLLEKATELGVARIVPIQTARSVVKIKPQKSAAKIARWEKIMAGAARQCGRSRIPTIDAPGALARTLDAAFGAPSNTTHVITSPHGAASAPGALLADLAGHKIGLWVGCEGGWTEDEVDAILSRGARAMRMGPRVLRAETAAITAITLAQHLAGDLG